jgi:hypothetical protein
MSGNTPVITWTQFPSRLALSYEVKQHTLHDLAQYLVDAGPFKKKADCPWIKLATFGTLRTDKHSLRHDANVVEITGVEGDYDAEQVTAEQAIEMLERAGIRAIVYTSPSNGVVDPPRSNGGPRWRVIAPLSKPHSPSARKALLARVNGALGGILAAESFTLSQSYFYGEVEGVDYRVYVTWNDPEEGTCVDDLDELDDIAIHKNAKEHANDEADRPSYSIAIFEERVNALGRKLKTGDGRRDLLKQYIASRSGKGLLKDEIITMVEGVINRYFDEADPIDQANVLEIINSFAKKDAANASQPVDLSGIMPQQVAPAPVAVPIISERSKEVTLSPYPDPFNGVMKDICDAAAACAFKVQPKLNMLGALIGIAGAVSGEYSTKSGGRFNLFGLGALESGGGKDVPRQMAEAVAAYGGGAILGKPASGAGLEDSIHDRRSCLVSVDEVAHLLKAVNDERAPSHLRDIGAVVLKLYSASRGVYNRRVLARAPSTAKMASMVANPCLSVIGFATPDGMGAAFHEDNLKDGLMGRMLYVQGDPGVMPRRPGSGLVIPDSLKDWAKSLKQPDPLSSVLEMASLGSVIVQEAHGISDKMDKLLVDMERSRRNAGPLGPSLYARSYEKLERIACLLAIAEDPQAPVIRIPHVEWARAMVMASDDHILAFANQNMHTGEVTKNAEKLRQIIRKIQSGGYAPQRPNEKDAIGAGMIARSQLLRVSKFDKAVFDKCLAHMHDLEELYGFDDKGKPLPVVMNIDLNGPL